MSWAKTLLLAIAMMAAGATSAQVTLNSEGLDAAYVDNIVKRSQKIVDALQLTDATAQQNVRNIIANRYFMLNRIHSEYDQTRQWAKEQLSGSERDHVIKDAEQKRDAELYRHHFELQSALAAWCTAEQIDAVKDGMTFGRLKRDYAATLDMIPRLTAEEKAQVLIWLQEAREFAMDCGDSKQKHAWFDKYRGRTNNWLSARGYDLKKEREDWQRRLQQQKAK